MIGSELPCYRRAIPRIFRAALLRFTSGCPSFPLLLVLPLPLPALRRASATRLILLYPSVTTPLSLSHSFDLGSVPHVLPLPVLEPSLFSWTNTINLGYILSLRPCQLAIPICLVLSCPTPVASILPLRLAVGTRSFLLSVSPSEPILLLLP